MVLVSLFPKGPRNPRRCGAANRSELLSTTATAFLARSTSSKAYNNFRTEPKRKRDLGPHILFSSGFPLSPTCQRIRSTGGMFGTGSVTQVPPHSVYWVAVPKKRHTRTRLRAGNGPGVRVHWPSAARLSNKKRPPWTGKQNTCVEAASERLRSLTSVLRLWERQLLFNPHLVQIGLRPRRIPPHLRIVSAVGKFGKSQA